MQELKQRQDRDSEEWKDLMERMVSFLRSSKIYSCGKAFGLIDREDPHFYEAQAIVLSNIGSHKQALEIYVFKIKDFEKAEEYCNRPSRMTLSLPYITPFFLSISSHYLHFQPNWPPALKLLSKHGSRLPASSTLDLIPEALPVAELESYFRGRIRAANSIVSESRVVAGLRKSEVVRAQSTLLLGDGLPNGQGGRNRRVVVSDERVCGVCHKRLGGSVIAVLPDSSVVHYGCLGRANVQRPPSSRGSWGGR
ncbi:hypothetical protein EYC84_006026 [Monilinia fructicola]|uniref:Vacuolar sorting protein 39/Transforming growth factor beta receptor-associated zinc finger domain-containing protein n=1 Tax=Monilinia fructicola TaxID=38448 RepID=A0A5M9K3J0_MONFR|nr:hypothetical protein EYC84_006026 [Monilinia fructicola]